ncbi:MAG: divergent PAP2 family protein [bacterium]
MLPILLPPIIAGIIAQTSKFFIKSNHLKFKRKELMSYSGMPSGHAAIVISLSVSILLNEGLGSPLFAISSVVALVVIRDAMGIRRYLGQHGRTLNILVKDLSDDNVLDKNYPHLLERIGHTPAQIIVGTAIGLVVSLAYYFLLY